MSLMKPFKEQFAEFDARRGAARVSDDAVSRMSGVPQANISRYRTGRTDPRMSRWIAINNALDAIIAERLRELKEAS